VISFFMDVPFRDLFSTVESVFGRGQAGQRGLRRVLDSPM